MKPSIRYLHLQPDGVVPVAEDIGPFLAIVYAEEEVSQIWQWDICRWLVAAGARNVLACGVDGGAWQEAVEDAADEAHGYEGVPDDQLVLASAHEDEDIEEVFWFARHKASHPGHRLEQTLILHIADAARQDELKDLYRAA
jgi:hypothetical protein